MNDRRTNGAAASQRMDGRDRVLAALRTSGAISRADLARRTGLAHSTVSAIAAELLDARYAVEVGTRSPDPGRPKGGRPAVALTLGRRAGVAVGVDIGNRHLRVAVTDLAHNVLAEGNREFGAMDPVDDVIAGVAALVEQALKDADAHRGEVIGVGIGVPSAVRRNGEIADTTVKTHWVGINAAQTLATALGLPVHVDNDANLGALSEWMWGAARGRQHLAYVKIATSIGIGLILDGHPYRGADGIAGEMAHTVIDRNGPICLCGNRGCLVSIAGGYAILNQLRASYGTLTLDQLVTHAHDGDPGCRRALADAGHAIGTALAGMSNLINPQSIIVGGDLAAAEDLLLSPIRQSLAAAGVPTATKNTEVLKGALGDRAEVLGAVALALHNSTHILTPASGPHRDQRSRHR